MGVLRCSPFGSSPFGSSLFGSSPFWERCFVGTVTQVTGGFRDRWFTGTRTGRIDRTVGHAYSGHDRV